MAFIKIGDKQKIINVYSSEEDLKEEKNKKEKEQTKEQTKEQDNKDV